MHTFKWFQVFQSNRKYSIYYLEGSEINLFQVLFCSDSKYWALFFFFFFFFKVLCFKKLVNLNIYKIKKVIWQIRIFLFFLLLSTSFDLRSLLGEIFVKKNYQVFKIVLKELIGYKRSEKIKLVTKYIHIHWMKIIFWYPSVFNWPLYLCCQDYIYISLE